MASKRKTKGPRRALARSIRKTQTEIDGVAGKLRDAIREAVENCPPVVEPAKTFQPGWWRYESPTEPNKAVGELDLIRDTIVKHRMHAENIKERLAELVARLFGESSPVEKACDHEPYVAMLPRIRDEADELGAMLTIVSEILTKLETL